MIGIFEVGQRDLWPARNDLTLCLGEGLFLGRGIEDVRRDMTASLLQPGEPCGFRAIAKPFNFFQMIG